MGPKPTPSKKGNTLFSYFTKSPANAKSKPTENNTSDVLSPKRSPNNKKSPVADSPKTVKKSNEGNGGKPDAVAQSVGDIVWAKLEGYPWWASLVCNHPTDHVHYKLGKNPQIHVQFFDDPPTRAWIKAKNVKEFKGADHEDFKKGGQFFSYNKDVQKGAKEADDAIKLSVEERLNLVVELQPSDDEDEMDLDPDIFDDEMDEETDNSKENKDLDVSSTKTPFKTTPSKGKSPVKARRSTRKPQKKRRRIVEHHSGEEDSEDDFKPHSESDESEDASSGVDEEEVSEPESESEVDSPVKKSLVNNKKRKRPAPVKSKTTPWKPTRDPKEGSDGEETPSKKTPATKSSFTPNVGEKTKSKLAMFSAPETEGSSSKSAEQEANFPHLKLDFLQPEKIKDAKGKRMNDPDYDPRTLHIPDSFKNSLTPALRQWWDIKAQLYDTVLFFKMGKFYELFHMDAVTGVNELGLIYMKGDYAHSGFPEIAYNRYADTLIQKGYKVARIEQTETPDMMQERVKNMSRSATKYDKVVKREVCRITTKGTQTLNFLDGDCSEAQNSYLLALTEKEENIEGCSTYGICFVDTSIGKFLIGQFMDDRHCSRLRTMLAHYTPVQVLLEKGKLSEKTLSVIDNNLRSVVKDQLRSGTEFWEGSKTLKVLAEEEYFKEKGTDDVEWPECLKKMISDSDSLGLTPADDYNLALKSLGAVTWYLQFSLLDQEILSMKSFEEYIPLDSKPDIQEKKSTSSVFSPKQHMVLDGVTLANLDILVNSVTGTTEGTLLQRLDQCCTPFGKRLFRQWLCAPLCNPTSISDRLDALDDLNNIPDVVADVTELMRKLPDLERILGRIHSLGSAARSKNHPDSRAIMFDEAKYSKKKIEDFLQTLDGFKSSYKVAKKFKDHVHKFRSKLLRRTATLDSVGEDLGHFPDLKEELQFFDEAFKHEKARKDGVIVPNKGVDPDYDQAKLDIERSEGSLQDYLGQQKTRLGCKTLVYWGSGKNRYQIEVPEAVLKRVPDEYELMSSKKGWKRYRTKEIERRLSDLVDAEERKDVALKDTMRRIFHSFDERYAKWNAAVQCLSVLDVLISLAKYSKTADGEICRPEVVPLDDNSEPFIQIHEARHPCVTKTFVGGDFIPNNTFIGVPDDTEMDTDDDDTNPSSKVVLVTGPNMGGKSTLMRQVGLLTIMAQLGCYVPAEKCRLSPVDRIFTRLGASDRIMAGESTFFVELSETSAILQHATKHSLVLMDELGRGTATYDGTAIACAVVQELSQRVQCRTLFSTHYHSLVEEFSHDPNIRLGHMACMVENEDEEDPTQETITFLYKFTKGACPKSYGFNAARLANLPEEVIKAAVYRSKEFEDAVNRIKMLKSLWKTGSQEEILSMLRVS